jgi:hypothetical protein
MTDRAALGAAAMDALPETVRVGAFTFAIDKWTSHKAAGNSRYGECSSIEQKIGVQRDMATPEKAVDTFLHEVGHAIYWAYGFEAGDKEERIVSGFASAWVQVYRDNPWLLGWIAKTLESA